MKNRLICLALCLVMAFAVVLTGCSNNNKNVEEDITEKGSVSAKSLTMWVVSEKEVDAETASLVNDALNNITKTKFKTSLTVHFLTEDVYREVVSDTIRAYNDSRNPLNPSTQQNAEETTEAPADSESSTYVEETDTNEYGMPTTKYPALKPNQVDIIYIDGYDMYTEFVNNGWLIALESELSAASKKIKEYVSETLLNAAKLGGSTYAIPNNKTIGEYTYMLLDKELMDEYDMGGIYDQNKINGLFNSYIYNYLENVRKHHTDVLPIDASYEECLNLLAHYWSIDPNTFETEKNAFSFLGYRYTDPKLLSRGQTILSFDSLFSDEVFCENYLQLNDYKFQGGFFGTAADGQKAAIKFCTGDLADYETLKKDYYPVIVKYPSVDIEDVYSNMFGVCSFSADQARSMQIVTYLTSNAQFRNILQYGVEGTHYRLVEKDGKEVVERLNESYMMDIFKTGNAFIAYPEPLMDQNVWEIGKKQNREALVEPLLNFDFATIAKASGATTVSTPQVGGSGYVYTYATGYSKEILSQNALLKKWLEECDQTGKGVYVLHTNSINGQNATAEIYYYNNDISGATVSVNDADGTLSVNYTGTKGNGYELTVISFYGRKNSSTLKWAATVNNSAAETKVTYQNALLSFDFMNTEGYSVELTTGLTKGMVVENEAVWNWINASDKTGSDPFVATHVKTVGEGADAKKIYTYLFYAPTIANPYSVSVQPTGDRNELKLGISYKVDANASLGANAPKYAMFLITVTVDSKVQNVQFNLDVNGNGSANVKTSEFESDPEFRKYGNLDTELVNYIYKVNQKIGELLGNCKDLEELTQLVADLKVLLKVPTKQPIDGSTLMADVLDQITSEALKTYINTLDGQEFYWNLYCATSSAAVKVQQTVVDDKGNEKLEEVKTHPVSGEDYVYYSSPYMLYYNWLKSNGFAK